MSQMIQHQRTSRPPAQKKWTVAEFHDLCSSPRIRTQRPYLINGVIWEQGETNSPHANGVEVLNLLLIKYFSPKYRVRCQLPLVFGLDTDPMPDMAVVDKTAPLDVSGHPSTAVLIVEVSDTTLYEDRTTKAELYAAAGIADYWILDVNNEKLIVHRQPDASGTYGEVQTYSKEASISPLVLPDAVLKVAEFF
jgi:Uma2 family endonuclease